MAGGTQSTAKSRSNAMLAVGLGTVFVAMIGVTFAAVPLYRMFCETTGYGGTTQVATQAEAKTVLARTIVVRFDANTSNALPWRFEPLQREITVRIGAAAHVKYEATNLAPYPTTGHVTVNVVPQLAGSFFERVRCSFCDTSQTLAAGETRDMDVVFYVDPKIVKSRELANTGAITLSYTMYPSRTSKPVASAQDVKSASTGKL